MEALSVNAQFYQTFGISSTDASHSGIGTATPIDYNLANIQKNSVIIVNVTVGVSAPSEPIDVIPNVKPAALQLERVKQIWGDVPAGKRLSEIVTDGRRE
jgi:hypothetical protein